MKTKEKKILLIAYQFCPKGQIGTRRWSKFAKYLTRRGYEVHVIAAKYRYRDKVNWCHEVINNPKIKITRISGNAPDYVLKPERTFGVKLLDRVLKHSLYWQDYSQYWGPRMQRTARALIQQEGIRHVIATGAPFSVLYQAAQLKQQQEDIKLYLDFRDPWTARMSQDGLLNKLRYKNAVAQEKFALEQADHVLLTTDRHRTTFSEHYPALSSKMSTLHNGFDEDDFQGVETNTSPTGFRFIYTGALMTDRAKALVQMVSAALELKDEALLAALQIDVYGAKFHTPVINDPELKAAFERVVQYQGLISQQEVFRKINEYPFCLTVNEPQHNQIIPAKTYDYMGMGKTIFAISPAGPLSELLLKHGQYWADFTDQSIRENLERLYKDYRNQSSSPGANAYQAYNYESLTDELVAQLDRGHPEF